MESLRFHRISLGLRFSLMVGAILLMFCALFSVVLYQYLKNQVVKDAEEKSAIIITHVKAVGGYVKETLRPKMFEILKATQTGDPFVLEAMSTTHVNLQVMKRFSVGLPDYRYMRVSDRPLNADNRADDFHQGLLQYFQKNRDSTSWHGIVTLYDRQHLVTGSPVISDESCLTCHQSRKRTPRPILQKYGSGAVFGWRANEVVGVETVSIPLDVALASVKKVALDTFTFGAASLGALFVALYAIFRLLVSRPLNRLSALFGQIAAGSEPLGKDIPVTRKDEIGDVTKSFNALSRHLLAAQEQLKKTAEIEKQMMETEKLASLGQLSAGVAHEINNPLGGIRLCFDNLLKGDVSAEKRDRHAAVINAGLDRIQTIVKGLLDFSRNAPLAMAPASMNVIIEDVLSLAEYTIEKKGVKLIKDLAPSMPIIQADANKLEQVFLNLIMNAVQAMSRGGVLTIRTRSAGASCMAAVSDTGTGIPADVLPRIFDPFFTTKGVGEGTGLGLTVSKAIVERHGGSISVETTDRGSTVTVTLPAGEA